MRRWQEGRGHRGGRRRLDEGEESWGKWRDFSKPLCVSVPSGLLDLRGSRSSWWIKTNQLLPTELLVGVDAQTGTLCREMFVNCGDDVFLSADLWSHRLGELPGGWSLLPGGG